MTTDQKEYYSQLILTKGAMSMLEEQDQKEIIGIQQAIYDAITPYANSEYLLPALGLVSLEVGAGVWKAPTTEVTA